MRFQGVITHQTRTVCGFVRRTHVTPSVQGGVVRLPLRPTTTGGHGETVHVWLLFNELVKSTFGFAAEKPRTLLGAHGAHGS